MDDSEDEEQRAAGGPGPRIQWYIQRTSREPAGGVMNRLRCGRSSDSDGRSLHIAGPGQHAGPRHSTAPDGARRGTPAGRGWTRPKAETHGGPGRAGQQPKMCRWKLVTLQCQQTTVTELFRNDSTLLLRKESNRARIDFRSSVMENTLDTFAHSCDNQLSRSNRLGAYEAPPVLRTDLRPDSNSERERACSEDEREMGIQGNLNAQGSDTTLRPNDVSETKVETSSIEYVGARFLQGFKLTSDILKSNQDLDSGGVESKNTTEEDVPIALQPRSKVQLQHPTEATKNEDLLDRLQIEAELKELLKRLIIQNKKQQDKIQEMSFSLQTVLELQISIVQDVRRNIEAILQNDEYEEKFDNIPSSISDHRKLAKHFKPDKDVHDTSNRHFETYVAEDKASSRHCAFVVGSDRNPTDKDSAKSGVYIRVGCRKLLPTGPSLDDSAISNAKAFKVTPKKRNPKDTSNSVDNSKIDGSPSASDAGQETEASDESLNRSKDISESSNSVENSEIDRSSDASDAGQETEASDESRNGSEDISGLSDIEYSFDLKTPSFLCPKQTKKMQPKSKESQQDLPARHSKKSAVDTKHFFH